MNYEGGEAIGLFGSEKQIAAYAAKELGIEWKGLDEQGKQVARLKFAEAMQKAAGATGQAKRESGGLENQLGNLRQVWTDIQAKFGKPLLGVVLKEMKGFSEAAQNFDTDKLVSGFTKFIDKVEIGIGKVKTFFGFMADNWTTITNVAVGIGVFATTLGIANGVVKGITAVQIAWNLAMSANPISLIVIGIAALVAGGVLLWKNWDKIKNKAIELWDKFKQTKVFMLALKSPIGQVISAGVYLYKNWDTIKEKAVTLKNNVSKMITAMKDNTTKRFNDMVASAKALPGKMGAGIKSMAGKAVDGVTSMGNKLVSKIGSVVNGVIKGLNWATKGVGLDTKIAEWKVPQYAKGTGGHPGGPAILGDGRGANAGPELYRTPDGRTGLSPSKDTMMNLPKGTQVLSAKETRNLLGSPAYAKGIGSSIKDAADWVGDKAKSGANWAGDKAKVGASAVADTASDIWSYASDPGKLMGVIMKKFGVSMPKFDGAFGNIAKGGFDLVKDKGIKYLKDKLGDFGLGGIGGGASSVNISGGAAAWRGQIIKAAAVMQEALSGSELNGIIAQISRESSGNQRIVQSPNVRDINTRNGNPAKGLLQYIPQTFARYRMPGAGNIFDGYHQLLAFFNNTNWRRDLPYGRRGWGPTGGRKFPAYANGTDGPLNKSEWAIAGEKGPELLNLKKGTSVHSNKESKKIAENMGRSTTSPVVHYNPTVKIEVNGNDADSSTIRRVVKEALDDQYNRLMGIYETGVVL